MFVKHIMVLLILANVSLCTTKVAPKKTDNKPAQNKVESGTIHKITIEGSPFVLYKKGSAGCVLPLKWVEALTILDSDDKLTIDVTKKGSAKLSEITESTYSQADSIALPDKMGDYCNIQIIILDGDA